MQIDWLTVAAQIVNFLVLLWLLRRFLYGPITRAMARREQRIADRLRAAEDSRREADEQARQLRQDREDLDRRRGELLARARASAEEERRSLEQAARDEVGRRRAEWLKELDDERELFLRTLGRHAAEHFYALARRALADLANAELEEQLAQVFVDQLAGMGKAALKKLSSECAKADGAVTVRSAFELSPAAMRKITRAVHEHIFEDAEVSYEQSESITCGIELKCGSRTVAWTLGRWLDALEREAGEQFAAVTVAPADRAAES